MVGMAGVGKKRGDPSSYHIVPVQTAAKPAPLRHDWGAAGSGCSCSCSRWLLDDRASSGAAEAHLLCRQDTTMGLRSATLAALAATVAGHGAIISPRSRNSVDYLVSCSGASTLAAPASPARAAAPSPRSHIMPRRWASTPPRTGPRTRTAPTSRAPTPGTATTVVRSPRLPLYRSLLSERLIRSPGLLVSRGRLLVQPGLLHRLPRVRSQIRAPPDRSLRAGQEGHAQRPQVPLREPQRHRLLAGGHLPAQPLEVSLNPRSQQLLSPVAVVHLSELLSLAQGPGLGPLRQPVRPGRRHAVAAGGLGGRRLHQDQVRAPRHGGHRAAADGHGRHVSAAAPLRLLSKPNEAAA